MVRSILVLALFCAAGLPAQQGNQGNASLVINGVDGPPFPILDVPAPLGEVQSVVFSGEAQQPVFFVAAPILSPGSLNTSIGLYDLPLIATDILIFGELSTDAQGSLTLFVPISSAFPPAFTYAYQGALMSQSAPNGARLTAATRILTVAGVFDQPLVLGDNTSATLDLGSYGVELPFYDALHTTVFVNANGSLSFGQAAFDFTATPGEFLAQMPRVAPFWADLSPNLGGQVTWTLDLTFPIPRFTVRFRNVATFPNPAVPVLPVHGFSVTFEGTPLGVPPSTAEIVIAHDAANPASLYDTIVGVSVGGNLGGASPSRDLSALAPSGGFLGGPLEAVFEAFGGTVATPGGNPYDLAGVVLTFSGLSTGTAGAQYFLN